MSNTQRTWASKLAITALLATGLCSTMARAQEFPSQDVRLICAFPAGSGSDVVVRYFAEKLKPILNRNVFVENKRGANGMIAMTYSARAKPDGHVIYLHTGSSMSANMHIFKNVTMDAGKEFQVAATINRQAFMLVVYPKRPWKSAGELAEYAKVKGDKGTYAVSGNGSIIMCSIYKEQAGLATVDVSYKSANDTLNDIASGNVDFSCHDPAFALSPF